MNEAAGHRLHVTRMKTLTSKSRAPRLEQTSRRKWISRVALATVSQFLVPIGPATTSSAAPGG